MEVNKGYNQNNMLNSVFGEKLIVWFFLKNSKSEYLIANPLSIMRPNDIICLTKNNQKIDESWIWAKLIFNYTDDQVYFYEMFETDEDERKVIVDILNKFKNLNCIIFPSMTNHILAEEAARLGVEVFSDDFFSLPDKRWLHPSISEIYTSDIFGIKFPSDVKVPKGFTCHNKQELRTAKEYLNGMGISKMLIKNAMTSCGIDIY